MAAEVARVSGSEARKGASAGTLEGTVTGAASQVLVALRGFEPNTVLAWLREMDSLRAAGVAA